MKRRILMLGAIILLAGAGRVFAHHAFTAEYDATQKLEVRGRGDGVCLAQSSFLHENRCHEQRRNDAELDSRMGLREPVGELGRSPEQRSSLATTLSSTVKLARDPSAHRMLVQEHQEAERRMGVEGQTR